MRLHRFYIKEKIVGELIIVTDEKLIHQWRDVFRLSVGDRVILFDGSGDEFVAEFKTLKKDKAIFQVLEKKKGITIARDIWLFVGIPKKDKLEWIVEKATELGVSHIVPIIAERSEKKGISKERLQKIIIEASEQSGRATLPELHEIISLEKAIDNYKNAVTFVVFDSSGISFSNYQLIPTNYQLGLFIGPEGGWSESEIELFKKNKIPIVSLGELTLRTETAAVVAISMFSVN